MNTRAPYSGPYRKLLLAFDVGTTYSGVSYSILDPGKVPEIKRVTRYPAQEHVGGDSKIPTIIYYNKNGGVEAVGAEAASEGIQEKAEDEGWVKAEWFKLHLRPKTTSSAEVTRALPPLPENKTAVDLLTDFMRYLYACTKAYIQDTHANGSIIWGSVENLRRIEFVLSHPNGWEGAQQAQMRTAAIQAGLIPDTSDGHKRIHFVTEGEASLHFCIQSGLTIDCLKRGDGILIVDAGGGTIDISAYAQSELPKSKGLSFTEIAPPQCCHFQGSIFVTNRARTYLEDLLRGSKFSDDVEHIANCFDKTTKLAFRSMAEPQFIRFGSTRDRDLKLNIRSGQLKLSGIDIATFFDPSISCAVRTILEQRQNSKTRISSVFLVGGFAASDWLFTRLKDSLEPFGLDFCRPDSHVNKAVADGAVSFYLDHLVKARVSKFSYGTNCNVVYNPKNKDHKKRSRSIYIAADGQKWIPGCFDVILQKNTQISETKEFRQTYLYDSEDRSELFETSAVIRCYRGPEVPRWTDVNNHLYSMLCTIEADTSTLAKGLKAQNQRGRRPYYHMEYEIVLSFGLTELKAQICWKENGKQKSGPARVVYDSNAIIQDCT